MTYVYNVQPVCDSPIDGSMETGGGLRLCCNPVHRTDPRFQILGPVWHRIADWDTPGMDVFTYFRQKLAAVPKDASLVKLPLDSACGKDCRRVIDAAAAFFLVADLSAYPNILEAANISVQVFWRG